MKQLLDDVRAFHCATDTPVLDKPQFPNWQRVLLRMKLVEEEYHEFRLACFDEDLIELADALADMVYVIIGLALEFGIPLDRVWNEVQRSNMAKVDSHTGKVKKREDGKILKPDGWQPPDIRGVLGLPPPLNTITINEIVHGFEDNELPVET